MAAFGNKNVHSTMGLFFHLQSTVYFGQIYIRYGMNLVRTSRFILFEEVRGSIMRAAEPEVRDVRGSVMICVNLKELHFFLLS